jgi:Xaa-Pro aminopeptidase
VDFAARQSRLSAALEQHAIELFFCLPSGDLEYLTGFPRRNASFGNFEYAHQWTAGAFFRPGRDPVFVVPRAFAAFNLPEGVSGETIEVDYLDDPVERFEEALRRIGGGRRIGLAARTWASTSTHLQSLVPEAELIDGDDLMNGLRRIKDADEIEAMHRASQIADAAMAELVGRVAAGVTELELACEVDFQLRRLGARTPAFDIGVFAMGRNIVGRDASTRVSARTLAAGDAVSFDFGGVVDGYCSDFGRTVYVGEPDEQYVRCHELVTAAYRAGVAAAVPGNTAAGVDVATRTVIDEAGYGEWYRHRTGHCIGLDTHERPFLSIEDQTVLEPGMAFTIEPSIFWPGNVGVRVEDLLVLEEHGCRNLNDFHHDLIATAA